MDTEDKELLLQNGNLLLFKTLSMTQEQEKSLMINIIIEEK